MECICVCGHTYSEVIVRDEGSVIGVGSNQSGTAHHVYVTHGVLHCCVGVLFSQDSFGGGESYRTTLQTLSPGFCLHLRACGKDLERKIYNEKWGAFLLFFSVYFRPNYINLNFQGIKYAFLFILYGCVLENCLEELFA